MSLFPYRDANPKNQWIIEVSKNKQKILDAQTMAERKEILDNISKNIRGIGPATVDETLAHFEASLGEN